MLLEHRVDEDGFASVRVGEQVGPCGRVQIHQLAVDHIALPYPTIAATNAISLDEICPFIAAVPILGYRSDTLVHRDSGASMNDYMLA
jgi:hypothetical protein